MLSNSSSLPSSRLFSVRTMPPNRQSGGTLRTEQQPEIRAASLSGAACRRDHHNIFSQFRFCGSFLQFADLYAPSSIRVDKVKLFLTISLTSISRIPRRNSICGNGAEIPEPVIYRAIFKNSGLRTIEKGRVLCVFFFFQI